METDNVIEKAVRMRAKLESEVKAIKAYRDAMDSNIDDSVKCSQDYKLRELETKIDGLNTMITEANPDIDSLYVEYKKKLDNKKDW
jgi:hypothetical protein